MSKEPVLVAITAVVVASVALLAAFGLEFTTAQSGAIAAWVAAVYGLAVLVRSKVTPTGAGT